MKIAFLFMSGPKGFGGHHISTHELMNRIREKGHQCVLISIGSVPSKVFLGDKQTYNFSISALDYMGRKSLCRFIQANKFDVYFPMDETSCRILCSLYPKALSRMIPVKPGWKNVSSWINLTSDFICFTKENVDYMRHLKKYERVNVHLIPNRVSKVLPNHEKINRFKERYNIKDNEKILFSVSRIDPDKTAVFYTSIKLSEKLNENGVANRLFIIGSVSSEKTLTELSERCGTNYTIVTDNTFTNNVSSLFFMAYIIVCMGRTAMESMSLGIPTFIPYRNNELPILAIDSTFESMLAFNFTYRSEFSENQVKNNEFMVRNIESCYSDIVSMSDKLFMENLDVEKGINKYIEIAEIQQYNKCNKINEFRACIYSNIRWIGCCLISKIKRLL